MGTRSSRGIKERGKRSRLEVLVEDCAPGFAYEAEKLTYIYPETKKFYLPDFTKDDIVLEAKGRFTAADRKKMLLIQEQYPKKQILMIFGRPDNKLSKKSKTTYGDWCTKNNISWVGIETFQKENKKICLLLTMQQKIFGTLPILPKRKSAR